MNSYTSKRAFTLVEIMVASTLGTILILLVIGFFLMSLNGLNASAQRMNLGYEINKFTNELSAHGTRAGLFILYKSPAPGDFDGVNPALHADPTFPDRQYTKLSGALPPADPLYHPAGDFGVFVFYEFPKPANQAVHCISRIEGYYLMGTDPSTGIGQVKKVVVDLSAAPSVLPVEAILTADCTGLDTWISSVGTVSVTTIFPMVRGLAKPEIIDGDTAPANAARRLFYMSADRNVIISGQHYSGNADRNTANSRTFTNSFCFSISPRTT